MATTWGSWAGPSSNRFRVGIDVTTTGTKVDVIYWVTSEHEVADNEVLTLTGALTGTVKFYNNSGGGGTIKVAGKSFTATRGKTYTLGAKLSGVYNGAAPSVSATVKVPALAPATPIAPTFSKITQNSAVVTLAKAPDDNGAKIEGYRFQWSASAGGGTTLTGTSLSKTITGLPANTTISVKVGAFNDVGNSMWSGIRSFTTLPNAPEAPGKPIVSRQSDAQHTITWVNYAYSPAPYTNVIVQRRINGGSWVTLATLAGTVASYVDKTTKADGTYEYRVASKNSSGTVYGAVSDAVYTTPKAPGSVPAILQPGAVIQILVFGFSTLNPKPKHELSVSINGGAYTVLTTLASGVSNYNYSVPNAANTYTFRARAINSVGSLASGYTLSNTVPAAIPPLAPTVPSSIVTAPTNASTKLTWKHNSVDTSDQTKYQIRHRLAGTSTWVTMAAVTSSTSSVLWSALYASGSYASGDIAEWQVATWGAHATASPWSSTSTVIVSSPPVATILTPQPGVLEVPTVQVAWEYFHDAGTPQGKWQAELLNEFGGVVETRSGAGIYTTFTTFDTLVADKTGWTVRVRLMSNVGLWSDYATADIVIDYPEAVAPITSAEWLRDTGSMAISIENPPSATGTFTRQNWSLTPTPVPVPSVLYFSSWHGEDWEFIENATDGPVDAVTSYLRGISVDAGGAAWAAFDTVNSATIAGRPALDVGTHFVISMYLRLSGTGHSVKVQAMMSGGVTIDGPTTTIEPGVWTRVSADVTLTKYSTSLNWRLRIDGDSWEAGEWLELAAILVEFAPPEPGVGDYFDGTFPSYTRPDGCIARSTLVSSVPTQTLSPAPEPVYNRVYRSIDGGEYVLIADQVPVNGSYVDPIPSIAGVNTYKSEAVTDILGLAPSEPVDVEVAEPGWIYLNYGAGMADFVRFYGNASLTGSVQREKALHRFAGRRKRSVFFGDGIDQTIKVSGRLTPDASTLAEMEAAVIDADVVCFRDPKGRRIFGALGALSHTHETPTLVAVSFDVEEVDYAE